MNSKQYAAILFVLLTAAIFSGCTKNFLIRKNGEHYFIATKQQKGLKKLLCDSGDIDAILKDSKLEKPLQDQLYSNICAETYNSDKTLELLSGMSRNERENLKFSFEQHGYDVNNLC